jgi:hypothetical protein
MSGRFTRVGILKCPFIFTKSIVQIKKKNGLHMQAYGSVYPVRV